MKKFAVFMPDTEQAQIIEGNSAIVTRKPDGLKIVIHQEQRKKVTIKNAIIFTEVSEQIKVL